MPSRHRVFRGLAAALIGLLLTMAISTTSMAQQPQGSRAQELAKACKSKNGTWLERYWECEYVDQQWCTAEGGHFEECASACRHNPEPATACTMQCIPLCDFSAKETTSGVRGPLGPAAGTQ